MTVTIAPSERIAEKALEESKSGGAGWRTFSAWSQRHKGEETTVEERVHEEEGGNFLEIVIITEAAKCLGVEGSPDAPDGFIDFAAEAIEQVTEEHEIPKEAARGIVADISRGIIAASAETREEVKEMIEEGEIDRTGLIVDLSEKLIEKREGEIAEAIAA